MIVYGYVSDQVNGGFIFSGGSYDPAGDSWASITTTNAPAHDNLYQSPKAVWTGSKLLIYEYISDQVNGGSIFNGGSYDPAGDSWTTIPTVNAPASPNNPSNGLPDPIWTGSKMIVYGVHFDGSNGTTSFSSSIYNPTGNSWAPITTTGAPVFQGTSQISAVWTGTKLLVHGNDLDQATQNEIFSGGCYDPTGAGTWTPITTTGAPVFSNFTNTSPASFWTGTKMIFYGAIGTTNITYGGGIYDPVNNSWTTIPSWGAPVFSTEPHHKPTALWTGSKMIFYGAIGTTNITYGGGIYDPSVPSAGAWSKIRDASGGEKILFLYAKP